VIKAAFATLVLEPRADGLRAVHVPREVAPLLQQWVSSHQAVDPVEFLRQQLRKHRLPEPALRS
jgi:hypothetical protein